MGFAKLLRSLLVTLTGVPVNKIRFVNALGGVGVFSCFPMVSRDASGKYFESLLVVRSRILRVLR